ncbi:MAG: hypothetical protein NTY10_04325 [Candidatus Omnitrophica bacterium]|nr:hypothetical protein [Candidatus Omnitrophota bacterium]
MAKVTGNKIPLERKYQVFVNGYEIDVASAVNPGIATTELKTPVFGSDDPILATIVDNGTISVEVTEKAQNNVLLDNLCNVSPAKTAKAYNFNNFNAVSIWLNRKSQDNSQYIGAEFYGNCSLAPSGKAGAPNAWGTRTFAGNCTPTRKFEIPNVAIAAEKIAITSGAGTLTDTPHVNPDDGFFAIGVIALKWDVTNQKVTESEILTVDAGMVTVAKAVTSDLVLTDVNAAYVIYLSSGAGVYPTGDITIEGLYKVL